MSERNKWLLLLVIVIACFYLAEFTRSHLFGSFEIYQVRSSLSKIQAPFLLPKIVSKKLNIYENDTSCYYETADFDGVEELDYLNGDDAPKLGESIFFHETSCFGKEGVILNARQACAVESAAKMNPNKTVYLLYLSDSKISKSTEQLVQQLLSYENINIKKISAIKYVKNTPLEKWYASEILKTSHWPKAHISDILRYLTLWKYRGIYMDLDVVVTTCLENLDNFAGAESENYVAAGVLGFGKNDLGRGLAEACLTNLQRNFKGDVWGNNGPGVITRILQKLCVTKYVSDMTPARCKGFNIFPPSAFYPINAKNWTKYFRREDMNETMEIIENARAIHVWNKYSNNERIKIGSEVPYSIVAKKYCPKVYNICEEFF